MMTELMENVWRAVAKSAPACVSCPECGWPVYDDGRQCPCGLRFADVLRERKRAQRTALEADDA